MLSAAAVVVTRNRLDLLKQCLKAIEAQTVPVSHIVVVDNASEQDTRDFLRLESTHQNGRLTAVYLDTNQGPAGGFHEGLRVCLSLPYTHMWLMDDDCMPEPEALSELISATQIVGLDAVLGGNVFDGNKESVNVQPTAGRIGVNGVSQYPYYLANGIIELEAISFASFFVPSELVRKAGLPMKELFLWGDDHEYSLRLGQFARLFQVGKSRMVHFKSGDAALRIAKETKAERIPLYRYLYRNRFYIIVNYNGVTSTAMAKLLWRGAKDIALSIRSRNHVALKCATIAVSFWEGVSLTIRKIAKSN